MDIFKVENVVQVAAGQIKPYEQNVMNHPPEQIRALADLILQVGFLVPIVLDADGKIVAGHGRFEAGRLAGMSVFPCVYARHLSARQIQAFRIADNQMGRLSAWNYENLAAEISALVVQDFDISLIGFDEQFLDGILKTDFDILPENKPKPLPAVEKVDKRARLKEGLTDDDNEVDAPEPVTRPGDVWRLGVHRVMCGDATNRVDVLNLLAGDVPVICVTDPPYGVNYDPNWRKDTHGLFPRTAETSNLELVTNDHCATWAEAFALFPGSVMYVWHASLKTAIVQNDLEAVGFDLVAQIIWRKQHFALGRGDYHWQHEPCFYAVRRGEPHNWQGSRNESTVWDIRNLNPMGMNKQPENGKVGHSTQKPVECMLRPMLNNTAEGAIVYDPFLGSGTTVIAGEKSLRIVRGMEINPAFVDMAIVRWQLFTGKKAVRQDGRTFDELLNETK